ncbi:oligosaccharide flippase family protein [bacterium]|nr:oligosaccharide flippase family protein [bacterium]
MAQKTSKKAGIVLFSSIVSATNQAVILILLARLLEKEIFGEVAKLIMIFRTAVILGNFGFNDNPFYFVPKISETQRGTFFLQCLKILFFSGIGVGLVSFGFFYYFFESYVVGGVFVFVIAFELMAEMTPNFFIAVGRAKAAAFFSIFTSFLNAAVILFVCLFTENKILNLTYGFLIYSFLRFLWTIFLNFKIVKTQNKPLPKSFLKEQLEFGIPIGFSQLAFKINKQIDNYVVAFFFPTKIFAEYSVGSWEIPMALKIPFSITSVYLTKYAELFDAGKFEELKDKFNQVTEKIILLLIPIATFFLVFGREIISLVFGSGFEKAGIVFQIYTITLFLRVASYSSFLKSLGESKFILKTSILLLSLNLILNVIFIQLFGLYGAPVGTLISNLIVLVLILRKTSSILRLKMFELLPYRFYVKTVSLAFAVCLFARFFAYKFWVSELVIVLFSVLVFLVGFFSLGVTFKLIGSEEKEYIFSLIKGKKK